MNPVRSSFAELRPLLAVDSWIRCAALRPLLFVLRRLHLFRRLLTLLGPLVEPLLKLRLAESVDGGSQWRHVADQDVELPVGVDVFDPNSGVGQRPFDVRVAEDRAVFDFGPCPISFGTKLQTRDAFKVRRDFPEAWTRSNSKIRSRSVQIAVAVPVDHERVAVVAYVTFQRAIADTTSLPASGGTLHALLTAEQVELAGEVPTTRSRWNVAVPIDCEGSGADIVGPVSPLPSFPRTGMMRGSPSVPLRTSAFFRIRLPCREGPGTGPPCHRSCGSRGPQRVSRWPSPSPHTSCSVGPRCITKRPGISAGAPSAFSQSPAADLPLAEVPVDADLPPIELTKEQVLYAIAVHVGPAWAGPSRLLYMPGTPSAFQPHRWMELRGTSEGQGAPAASSRTAST